MRIPYYVCNPIYPPVIYIYSCANSKAAHTCKFQGKWALLHYNTTTYGQVYPSLANPYQPALCAGTSLQHIAVGAGHIHIRSRRRQLEHGRYLGQNRYFQQPLARAKRRPDGQRGHQPGHGYTGHDGIHQQRKIAQHRGYWRLQHEHKYPRPDRDGQHDRNLVGCGTLHLKRNRR